MSTKDSDKKLSLPGLLDESDRGCVLVAAAMLDTSLSDLFKAMFRPSTAPQQFIDSLFESGGPLNSLSAKARLARAFGYISQDTLEDLNAIRKLRNRFAHTTEKTDFSNEEVAQIIENLHIANSSKVQLKGIRRFNLTEQPPEPKEAHIRAAGFVKFHKTLFCLAVGNLTTKIVKEWATYFRKQA